MATIEKECNDGAMQTADHLLRSQLKHIASAVREQRKVFEADASFDNVRILIGLTARAQMLINRVVIPADPGNSGGAFPLNEQQRAAA